MKKKITIIVLSFVLSIFLMNTLIVYVPKVEKDSEFPWTITTLNEALINTDILIQNSGNQKMIQEFNDIFSNRMYYKSPLLGIWNTEKIKYFRIEKYTEGGWVSYNVLINPDYSKNDLISCRSRVNVSTISGNWPFYKQEYSVYLSKQQIQDLITLCKKYQLLK